jgi:hypothetical protein
VTSYGAGMGDLVVKVGADISGLRRDVAAAAKSLDGLSDAASKVGLAVKAMAASAAVGAIADMVKEQMGAVDAAAKLSRQLGGTIGGLRGLQLAAHDAGVNSGALQASMEALNKKLGEAARTGKGEAFEAFQRLGLSARELGEMDVDKRIAAIADALKEKGLSAYQAADALAKMGLEQGQIVRLMQDGGDATREARAEIESLGLALSEVDAARVEEANQALHRVDLVLQGMAEQTAIALAPAIEQLAKEFLGATGGVKGFGEAMKVVGEVVLGGLGYIGDGVQLVNLGFLNLKYTGVAAAAGMLSAFEGVAHGVELITGDNAITDKIQEAGQASRQALQDVRRDMKETLQREWFHEKIDRVIAKLGETADGTKRKVDGLNNSLRGGGGGDGEKPLGFDFGGEDAEVSGLGGVYKQFGAELGGDEAKQREKVAEQLQALREQMMGEEELLQMRFQQQRDLLDEAHQAELVGTQEFHSLSQALEQDHMAKLKEIRERGLGEVNQVSLNTVMDGVSALSRTFTQLSSHYADEAQRMADEAASSGGQMAAHARATAKTMFDVHKGFAIADALIAGAAGVAQTLGAYPFPYNLAMAVPHAAAAAAQVATISSQSFNAGGGTVKAPSASFAGAGAGFRPSGAPSGATHGAGGQSGPGQVISLNMKGDTFSRGTVLALIEQFNEAFADGARLVVVE